MDPKQLEYAHLLEIASNELQKTRWPRPRKKQIRRLAAKFRCQSAADSDYGTEIPLSVR
jgi:hypothetical protein